MRLNPKDWCIDRSNRSYHLSPSYPPEIILPRQALEPFHLRLASFRTRGRFPALVWKNPHGPQMIMRSAQPLCGLLGARSPEDEWLIGRLTAASSSASSSSTSTRVWILDARSYAAAMANAAAGGGYEKGDAYKGTRLEFLSLANVHSIASSHSSLLRAVSASSSSTPRWYSILEQTGWLGHVAQVLAAAGGEGLGPVVEQIVKHGASVLVHCTDGWDRTAQLVSLAQIMLDPYYRTIEGFQTLIEKDWLAFGHPFAARAGYPFRPHYGGKGRASDLYHPYPHPPHYPLLPNSGSGEPTTLAAPSPIFLLFLTCVYHLQRQHPTAFEFGEPLLLCLAWASGGWGGFGDFLCDNERQRESMGLRQRTRSLWGWVSEHRAWFVNTVYKRPIRMNR
ncbi:MAG: protein-tyrosine phosphatase-like protein [Piptocephalis tieghemiana]|nr:MAG: protein-tyrosine phosphatase-like protein [Piptocephalis tieghemiana]